MKIDRKRFWLLVSILFLLLTFSELLVFYAVYNDIWTMNRLMADSDQIDRVKLGRIYDRTLQDPADSHLYQKLVQLATLYQRLGDKAKVIYLYRRALVLRPENREMRLMLANALRDTGQYAEAAKEYDLLVPSRNR